MHIFKRVNNFLTRVVRTNTFEQPPVVYNKTTGDKNNSFFTSSDEMGNIDTFEHSNQTNDTQPSTEKYSRSLRRKSRKEVRNRHNISFWDRLAYNVKDIFQDQDIAGQIRREFQLDESATEEDYIEAAKKHIHKQLEGLSESEIIELYIEMERSFALDITNRNDKDKALLLAIYSASLGEFNADSRAKMAIDLLKVADSDDMRSATAARLAKNAEFNMTNPDALQNKENPNVHGNVPSKEDATEYFSCVFENMTKKDIETALNRLSMRADEVEPRIKALLARENRTEEEELELQKLQLLHRNIVVAGLSGANIGIMGNAFVNTADVPTLLCTTNGIAAKHNIEAEVNKAIIEYLQAHPETKENIETLRQVVLEAYIEELQTNLVPETKPEIKSLINNKIYENKDIITDEEEVSEYNQKTDRQSVSQETKPSGTTYSQSTDRNSTPERSGYVSQRVVKNATETVTPTVSANTTSIKSAHEAKEYIKNTINGVKNLLTGKIECLSSSAETLAINQYKTLGKEQGSILANCKEKFFDKLKGITKISAVRSYLASGSKGNNFDRTEAMQEMINEDEEKRRNTYFSPRMESMYFA